MNSSISKTEETRAAQENAAPLRHVEKHRHAGREFLQDDSDSDKTIIALAGNPNVGKSLLFNFLSGVYVDVSNYPGTTVETTRGMYGSSVVYDTPGIYGVGSFTDEESVAREMILAADVILNVVDSVHLERDLFLTMQLIDMGKKVAVLLNFKDELKRQGIEIDVERLSARLGVPVFQTSAATKEGFERIDEAIAGARVGIQDPALQHELHQQLRLTGSEAEALLILEGDENVARQHGVEPGLDRERIYVQRRNRVNTVVNEVLDVKHPRRRIAELLGRWSINTWTGVPMLLAALYFIYLFVGKLVAQDLVNFTEHTLGRAMWEPWISGILSTFVEPRSWLGTILMGEFGVATMTVTYLLFLLLPLVVAFYLALAIMEDSGYLPRLATLVDRSLNAIGLNGSAIIPLILGFGCVTMATITTRILGTKREKQIVTTILQFAIPCSAQLAVIAALLASAGFAMMLVYSATILAVFVAIGTILHRILPGVTSPLLLDLPPMRFPRLDNVVKKTAYRTWAFMKEATPWFFAGALAVGIMQVTGLLTFWMNVLEPFTVHWLKLPREAAAAFVMGLVRRDFGAAGLYTLHLSPEQIVVALVTITLFVPCIASLMVMLKERGLKESAIIWFGTWIGAFGIGGIVSHILL